MTHTNTRWYRSERWISILARLLVFASVFVLLVLLIGSVSGALLPIAGGFLLAFFTAPLVDKLAKKMPRSLAVVLTTLTWLTVFVVIAALVIPLFTGELQTVAERIPEYVETVKNEWLPAAVETLGLEDRIDDKAIEDALEKAAGPLLGGTGDLVEGLTGFVGGMLNGISTFIMIVVFSLFFSFRFHLLGEQIRSLMPPRWLPDVDRVWGEIERTTAAWVRGQVTVCAILAVFYATGLTISGVNGAIVIGIFAGVVAFIPYLGLAIGVGLSVLMAALEGSPSSVFIGIGITFVVGQLLDSWVITPRIVGGSVGLSALGVLVALLIGGELAGMLGMLLAVPGAAIFVIVAKELIARYRESTFFTRET